MVERFLGVLKRGWIFNVAQPKHDHMKSDVVAYIKYYNLFRLHTAKGGVSPIDFEHALIKVPGLGWPEQGGKYSFREKWCEKSL